MDMATFGTGTTPTRKTPLQIAAGVVGAVFLLIGVLGFVPGVVTNYDALEGAGHESHALLLDTFQVSVLHNIVHLIFGVAGLVAMRAARDSRLFLLGGGVIYLVLWLYGLVVDQAKEANFVPVNTADNWLHLVLGVGMLVLGLVLPRMSGITPRTRTVMR